MDEGILLTELNGKLNIEVHGYGEWENIKLIRQAYMHCSKVENTYIQKLEEENKKLKERIFYKSELLLMKMIFDRIHMYGGFSDDGKQLRNKINNLLNQELIFLVLFFILKIIPHLFENANICSYNKNCK